MGREKEFDSTIVAKAIFECVAKVKQRFGINYLASVLVGSKSKKIFNYSHQELEVYGRLTEYSTEQIKLFIIDLLEQGYLFQTRDKYPVIRLLTKAHLAMNDVEQVTLHEPDPSFARRQPTSHKGESVSKSVEMYKEGKSIAEIATERNLAQTTVLGHLADAYAQGEDISIDQFVPEYKQSTIEERFHELGTDYLWPVKQTLGVGFSWEELKVVRAKILRQSHVSL